jgi:hypothetical protein
MHNYFQSSIEIPQLEERTFATVYLQLYYDMLLRNCISAYSQSQFYFAGCYSSLQLFKEMLLRNFLFAYYQLQFF